MITDAKGLLHESLEDAIAVRVKLPPDLGGLELLSERPEWKADHRARVTIAVDAYARLVVFAKCGDDLCKFASVDAYAIPPVPDLSALDGGRAHCIRSMRETDPLSYRAFLKTDGLLEGVPEVERQDAHGHSAELLIPYDGAVYVRVWAYAGGQAAVLMQTNRGTSRTVEVQVSSNAVVAGAVLTSDGRPAPGVAIYVGTSASFPPGDFTPRGSSIFMISHQEEPGFKKGDTRSTIHYRSVTDHDGRFSLPVMFTGDVIVHAFGSGGRPSTVQTQAKSPIASVRDLEIRLPAPAAPILMMRFVRTDGTPLVNAGLHAEVKELGTARWSVPIPLRTRPDGWADVSGLKVGLEYDFVLDGPGSPFGTATVKDSSVVTEGMRK